MLIGVGGLDPVSHTVRDGNRGVQGRKLSPTPIPFTVPNEHPQLVANEVPASPKSANCAMHHYLDWHQGLIVNLEHCVRQHSGMGKS